MRKGRRWLLAITLLLTGCTIWREHAVNTWNDATGAEGLERSFWNDVKARNWTDLEKHIAGNYIAMTSDGKQDRAAALERIKSLQVEDFSLGEVTTEMNGNTMVIAYSLTLRATREGHAVSAEPQRQMTVWQQQKAGWMAIAHSTTAPSTTPTPTAGADRP